MSQKAFAIKSLLMLLLVVNIIFLSCQFENASYDVISVTPLFFLRFANYLFTLSIVVAVVSVLIFSLLKDKILFIFSSLVLYFVVLFIPYSLFHFPIYNDQLGFAVEALYGMRNGVIMPYQGEYATLGHAYFTSAVGEILGLDLYQSTRFVETVFVLGSFVICLSLAMSILNRQQDKGAFFLAATVMILFPAFILEPLVYSRGYFGLVVSMVLFLCMFKFMGKITMENSILTMIIFVASSISYPIQPLVLVIAMAMLGLLLRLPQFSGKTGNKSSVIAPKTFLFFVVWLTIQVFLGHASLDVLCEIIRKAMTQEFFMGLKSTVALEYVGDAAVYVETRMLMLACGWFIAALMALIFILNAFKSKEVSKEELFAFSMAASLCLLGVIYGVLYHEPALRFYRSLIAALPFALAYTRGKVAVRRFRKMIPAFLLTATITFLILSPVTKWGWTFVGYPTQHDVALCNHIVSYLGSSPDSVLYAPGSHAIFDFFTKLMSTQTCSGLRVYATEDVEFYLNKSAKAEYTATFYRMYVISRWYGEDINITMDEITTFASQNNVLYCNGDLWLLIQKIP